MERSVAIEHTVVIDEDMPRRMARALLRLSLSRPMMILLLVVTFVIFALLGVSSTTTDRVILITIPLNLIFWALCMGAVVLFLRSTVKARIEAMCLVGHEYGVGLGDTALALLTPLSKSEVQYGAFESALLVEEFVMLKQRKAPIYVVLPEVLFPGDSLYRLRDKIATASRPSVK